MSDNITLPREVVQGALEALVWEAGLTPTMYAAKTGRAITALRAHLAAPRLEVTVDPRLTPDEAAAISSALAAPDDADALRRDAERYRYLRNRDPAEVMSKEGKDAGCWIDCEEKDDIAYMLQLLTGDDADAAIDAAMKGDKA